MEADWIEKQDVADAAERRLLGGLLRDPDQIGDTAVLLREDHLRHDAHRTLWRILLALWEARRPVDLPTVYGEILTLAPGEVGTEGRDAKYLAELWELDPTGGNVRFNLRKVLDASLFRKLALVGEEISQLAAQRPGPADQVLEQAERLLFALSDLGSEGQTILLRDAVDITLDRIDARVAARSERGDNPGVPSGIRVLDELTSGWQGGELVVVAARPSVGKTALSLTFARAAAEANHGVFYASLEQSAPELAERLLVAESGIEADHLRRGILVDGATDRLLAARDVISPLSIVFDPAPRQSLRRVTANARRLRSRGRLGLVLVDYLQLIDPESRKEPQHEQLSHISRGLKGLARELGVPVIALAQLNREVEAANGQRPKLSHLRGSGSIEQDADCVILLHRPPEFPHHLELLLAKQRNGPIGEITVRFDRARMRFESLETPASPDASAFAPIPD